MAINTPITILRGDTNYVDIAAKDTYGAPLDLTGCSVWFTIKRSLSDDDDDALVFKTLLDGINVTSAVDGLATVTIDPIDTSLLATPVMGAYYDAQIKDTFNNIFTIARGTVNIVLDVTVAS